MASQKGGLDGRPYQGDLKRPLPPVRKIGIRRLGEISPAQASALVLNRMFLLCDHYGVARADWFELALQLGMDHVPGLRHAKAMSGRKRVWTPCLKEVLAAAYEGYSAGQPDLTNAKVLERLAKEPFFAGLLKLNLKSDATPRHAADALRKHLPRSTAKPSRKTAKKSASRKAATQSK